MTKEYFKQLLKRYKAGQASPEERNMVDFWYASFKEDGPKIDREQKRAVRNDIYRHIRSRIDVAQDVQFNSNPSTSKIRKIYPYVAAAAAILIVAMLALFRETLFAPAHQQETVSIAEAFVPGGNKAQLILEDGQIVDLDSSRLGIHIGDHITYMDGKEVLSEDRLSHHRQLTLKTPRGGQYEVKLSDGSRVWLNADSKITYPTVFAPNIRRVRVEGEAYFEVTHNPSQPFVVETAQETIEVLGTKFNVNHYPDNAESYISLLQGSVRVHTPASSAKVLKPAQQAVISGKTIWIKPIENDEVVAWKSGEFMFNDERLEDVFKKLARWYDFDYEIDNDAKDILIWGSMSKYDSFEEALRLIKLTDSTIKIQIKGRRVAVVK